ncbi:unnamed protein product [Psylliodes chrysocephalus]|uniref:Uncharacterized protein n=1 Tax=Psylliodes chrysocephalus TaxID=3402493 RepID=A0A9P0CYV2_9CUCU|nr:unnamed protein product [Psylliodes chrysocephala]
MPSEGECSCCKTKCDVSRLVDCSVCNKTFKNTCAGLTINDLKTLSKNGISYTCPACLVIGAEINELRSVIIELRNEIAELKQSISPQNKPMIINSDLSINNILNEVYERQKRQCNLLLFNVPETNGINNQEKNEADAQMVKNILKHVSSNIPLAVELKHFRLGKFVTGAKPRPLEVILPDSQHVFKYLKNSQKLKTGTYKQINLAPDRTPM